MLQLLVGSEMAVLRCSSERSCDACLARYESDHVPTIPLHSQQIERHLASLSSRENHSPQAISDTIFFQHSTFMSLASQVANLHAEVEVLKRDYRDWYARQFRSVRDPFEFQGMGGALEMSQGF